MYKVTINDGQYDQKLEGELPESWDMVEYKDGCFHILYQDRSFTAEVLEADHSAKTFTIKVNKQVFTLDIADRFDQLIKQMGYASSASNKINQIKAPMPGMVVDILVKAGEAVEKGSSLLILGAMKMDNVIKSPGPGTVKKVKVDKGAAVDKNQILIEFE